MYLDHAFFYLFFPIGRVGWWVETPIGNFQFVFFVLKPSLREPTATNTIHFCVCVCTAKNLSQIWSQRILNSKTTDRCIHIEDNGFHGDNFSIAAEFVYQQVNEEKPTL